MLWLIPLTVLALFTLWLHRRLAWAPRWPAWTRRAIGVVLLVGLGAVIVAMTDVAGRWSPRQVRPLAWLGATWLAIWWYLLLGLTVLGIGSLLTRSMQALHGADRASRLAARRRLHRVGVPLVALASVATTAYGVGQASNPSVTPVRFTSPQLPAAFDGVRVALLSDIHAGAVRDAGFVRRVVERTNAARPDLVLIAGDLIDGSSARFGPELESLRDLRAPLGVFAVTGNHEVYSGDVPGWLAVERRLGITVLTNGSARVERGGATITVVGENDRSGTGPLAPDPATAFAGVDPAGFVLFVTHQPRQAFTVGDRGVDLQLSGHTHGGQLWPFRYLVRLQQPVVDGLHVVGGVPVLTSRGAGAWGPPVRVGAPPEIPVIVLSRA